ncbi:MAG TPA: hypothetical protein VKN73_07195 [Desulfosalsimonadaceae bacterium]|nr:hypothetical protein [Desulfosalsimonadaceae bacterium]
MNSDKDFDNLERRCPRLGSKITFRYCLISGEDDNPCWKIFDCWWEQFDVASYLKAHLPAEVFEKLVETAAVQPKNKLTSIVEIAEQAKQQKKK